MILVQELVGLRFAAVPRPASDRLGWQRWPRSASLPRSEARQVRHERRHFERHLLAFRDGANRFALDQVPACRSTDPASRGRRAAAPRSSAGSASDPPASVDFRSPMTGTRFPRCGLIRFGISFWRVSRPSGTGPRCQLILIRRIVQQSEWPLALAAFSSSGVRAKPKWRNVSLSSTSNWSKKA